MDEGEKEKGRGNSPVWYRRNTRNRTVNANGAMRAQG